MSCCLQLAVMWRKDKDLIYYDWLPDGWFPHGPQLDDAHAQLSMLVSDWLQSKHALPHVTDLNFELYNEHGYVSTYYFLECSNMHHDNRWYRATCIVEVVYLSILCVTLYWCAIFHFSL